MAKSFFRRRIILIAIATVALSVGIVFGSIPYLPQTNVPHGSLTQKQTLAVIGGDPSNPGVNQLELPNLVSTESFFVEVNATGGTPVFCVIRDTPFFQWFDQPSSSRGPFPTQFCIGNTPTQPTSSTIIKFLPPNQGTYFVVAINTSSSSLLVSYLPA